MSTTFAHVQVVGGILSRTSKPGSALDRAEKKMMGHVAAALPKVWKADVTSASPRGQTLFFTVPHRSHKQFAEALADFLREMDRQVEGFMVNRFIVTDLGADRNSNGRLIYDGQGLGLGQQILFWTGIDWTKARPKPFALGDEFYSTYQDAVRLE